MSEAPAVAPTENGAVPAAQDKAVEEVGHKVCFSYIITRTCPSFAFVLLLFQISLGLRRQHCVLCQR